jgi:hypothetical protein
MVVDRILTLLWEYLQRKIGTALYGKKKLTQSLFPDTNRMCIMTDQQKRKQELNMLIAKREDYLRKLRIEVVLVESELYTLKSEYNDTITNEEK